MKCEKLKILYRPLVNRGPLPTPAVQRSITRVNGTTVFSCIAHKIRKYSGSSKV